MSVLSFRRKRSGRGSAGPDSRRRSPLRRSRCRAAAPRHRLRDAIALAELRQERVQLDRAPIRRDAHAHSFAETLSDNRERNDIRSANRSQQTWKRSPTAAGAPSNRRRLSAKTRHEQSGLRCLPRPPAARVLRTGSRGDESWLGSLASACPVSQHPVVTGLGAEPAPPEAGPQARVGMPSALFA